MLTVEENERLTRIGPGTPMGKYMRRFWWPLCLSTELPERDGSPLRVRILGEDLIAFRDTNGDVGLIDAYCPHRRAPLFFGRNEECGLALRLSRLEIRPSRRLRRHAVRARGHDASGQGEDPRLSDGRKGRRGLVLYGPEGDPIRSARFRMDARARHASLRVEDLRELQLASGDGRRTRYRALLFRAQQQARRPRQSAPARQARRSSKSNARITAITMCRRATWTPASTTASITT